MMIGCTALITQRFKKSQGIMSLKIFSKEQTILFGV
jgi:hypothetical protein